MLVSRPPFVDKRGETNMPMGNADMDGFEVKELGETGHQRGNSIGSVESQPGAAKQLPAQPAKPNCARCREPIFGRPSTISERQFHAKCMKCSFGACRRPIPPGEPVYLYYDRGNGGKKKDRAWLPYCKDHCLYTPPYMGHCSAALCRDNLLLGKPITTVNGKKFHQACVFCCVCGCTFPNNRGVYLKNAKFYCKADYEQVIMPKCTVCKGIIRGGENIMVVNGDKMHAACLQLGEDDPEPEEPEPIDVSQQPDTELILLPSLPDSVRNSFDSAREQKEELQPPPRRPRGHRQMRSIIQVRESPIDSGWLGLVPDDEDANLADTQKRQRHERTSTVSSAAPTELTDLESFSMTLESIADNEVEAKDTTDQILATKSTRNRARTTALTTLPKKVIPPPPRRPPPPRPKAVKREGSSDSLRRSHRSCSQPDLTNAMKAVAASRLRKHRTQQREDHHQEKVQKKRNSVLDLVSRFER